jgi:DNA-binding SARP family transcriptional activator
MAEELRILLLGPPFLVYQGDPYPLKRRGVRSLLFYLACQPGPVARGALLDLLYGDEAEKSAKQKLRVLLSRLHTELPADDILVIEQNQISLNPGSFTCDVTLFEAAVEEISRAAAQIPGMSPLPEQLHKRILQAADLWRGPRFLEGSDLTGSARLDDWLMHTGQRLESDRLRLFDLLSNHAAALGDLETSAAWLRRALEIDPLADLVHLRLVGLLERQSRLGDAISHLQRAASNYKRDGQEGLPPALQSLFERLRAEAARKPAEGQAGTFQRRVLQLPLIGRREELRQLQSAYHRRQSCLVLGEAGSGKSRLVQEYAASLDAAPRLLTCSARAFGSSSPFQPMIEMLRAQVALDDWRKVSRPWLSALAPLLPELETMLPDLTPPTTSSISQSVIFEAIHQALKRLAEARPLLIILDDAQWYDETSLSVCAYLMSQRFFGERAGLIVAARLEDQTTAFQDFLRHLAGGHSFQRVDLGPLNEQDTAEMARLVFEREPPARLVAAIQRDTGGNPLFLLETLRALMELSLDPFTVDADRLPLASSIHILMHERLNQLSSPARALLVQAAVLGSTFPVPLLEKMADKPLAEVAELMDELETAHLISPLSTGQDSRQYYFVHDKLRSVLMLEVSLSRKRILHLRAAEAINGIHSGPADARAAMLAGHYEEAGEDSLAFDLWLAAADYAFRLYSNAEARQAFQKAGQILQRLAEQIPDDKALRFYTQWVVFLVDTAGTDELRQVAHAMLQAGYRRQNIPLIRGGFLSQASAADLTDDAQAGLGFLEQARPFLERLPPATTREKLVYAYRRGGFLITLNRFREAIEVLSAAVQLIQAEGEGNLNGMRANCLYRLAMAYLYHGDLRKAAEIINQSLDESRAAMNHASAARAMIGLGYINFHHGKFSKAEEYCSFAQRMIAPMQNKRLAGRLYTLLSQLALLRGQFDQSWQYAGQALEEARETGFPRVLSQAYFAQADVLAVLEDNQGAEALYRKSLDVATLNIASLESLYRLGHSQIVQGRREEGQETIERARAFCQEHGIGLFELHAEVASALALLAQGSLSEAVQRGEEIAARAVEREIDFYRVLAYQILGLAAQRAGRLDEAFQKGLAVALLSRELDMPATEISGLILAIQSGAPAQRDLGAQRRRLNELLARLDQQVHDPYLRARFEPFAARLRKLVETSLP